MARDVNAIVVGGDGDVWVAAVGTAAPADESAAPAAGWEKLGWIQEDGVTFRDQEDDTEVPAWQSFYALRRLIESKSAEAEFTLRQIDKSTIVVAMRGGSVSTVSAGHYKFTPPQPSAGIFSRAFLIDVIDGTDKYRFVIPKATVQEGVETQFQRTAPADLPLTISALGADATDPWYLLTNDAAFA